MNTRLLEELGFKKELGEWRKSIPSSGDIVVDEDTIYIYSGLGMPIDYGFEIQYSGARLKELVEMLS